ncbi:hypothetical protein [Anatilimnocola floriformis]|uniref:hypothetical protein n=1 Tax=Anatilimnocola floriformis TaxID=2948575 RepID=UPI0020C469BB|nr:hypothetical protein [Anatilimnocola floriformis]
MKRESRAPLIVAIVLLLLPVLYVGSYFALVVPGGTPLAGSTGGGITFIEHYRWQSEFCSRLFWPLEQIDRKVRPIAWEVPLLKLSLRRFSS